MQTTKEHQNREFVIENINESYWGTQMLIGRYCFASQFVKNDTVLDIACGSGYGASLFIKKGAEKVIGGDISITGITYAKKNYGEDKNSFFLLNATTLPFADGTFDTLISLETIEHLPQPVSFLAECRRVLKKGGTFVCSTPNSQRVPLMEKIEPFFVKMTPRPKLKEDLTPHIKEFSISELSESVGIYFNDLQVYGQYSGWTYKDAIKTKITSFIRFMIFYHHWSKGMMNFMTNPRFLRNLRPMCFPQVRDFEEILDKKYIPFVLDKENTVPPAHIIVVAKR